MNESPISPGELAPHSAWKMCLRLVFVKASSTMRKGNVRYPDGYCPIPWRPVLRTGRFINQSDLYLPDLWFWRFWITWLSPVRIWGWITLAVFPGPIRGVFYEHLLLGVDELTLPFEMQIRTMLWVDLVSLLSLSFCACFTSERIQ
jgi:hypothetical protein